MFGAWTEIFLHAFVVAAAAWLAVVAARNPDAIAFALKSILRRWRITSVVMATILVCVVALVALGGYFYHSFWGLSESTIRSETGHFQIYRKGYEANSKTDPWTWKLRQLREIRDLFASDTFLAHRVSVLAPELQFTGLLSNGDVSQTFLGRAVDPASDRKLSSFGEEIAKGSRFVDGDAGCALVGAGLAQSLSAKPGSSLTLLTSNPRSGMASADLDVKGVTESFSRDYDDVALKIPLSTAWDMIGDTLVDKVVVLLESTTDLDTVLSRTKIAASSRGLDFEYKTWLELATYYKSVKNLYTNIFRFFSVVILVFSVVFITSILFIMILQRTYEIALLRAFGAPPAAVLRNFVSESILMAFIGATASILIALFAAWIFNIHGLATDPPPGSTRGYVIKLRVIEEPLFVLQVWEFIVTAVVLSSIIPAWRGCRAKIVQSLRNG